MIEIPSFEPKKNNLFIVDLPEEFKIEPWAIQSITKPEIKNNKWSDIIITFLDPIGPSTSQIIFHYYRTSRILSKFHCKCSSNKISTRYKLNKKSLFNKILNRKLFSFNLLLCDPTHIDVEKWRIDVKDIKSVNYGNLDYNNDNIVKITITLKIKDCILNY